MLPVSLDDPMPSPDLSSRHVSWIPNVTVHDGAGFFDTHPGKMGAYGEAFVTSER